MAVSPASCFRLRLLASARQVESTSSAFADLVLSMRPSCALEGIEAWLLAAACFVSLSLPLFLQGRTSGVASLWHSAGRRVWRIEQSRTTFDASIARQRSSALIQRSR